MTLFRSLPGVGGYVLSTLFAEAFDLLQRRDYPALRARSGVAPVSIQSGNTRWEIRRLAVQHELRNALYHWARVAAVHDPLSKARYRALRARGHSHGRALRTVGDRLLAVACAMLKSAPSTTRSSPETSSPPEQLLQRKKDLQSEPAGSVGNAPLSAAAGEQPPPWCRVFQVLGKSLPAPPAPEAQTHLPSRFPRDGTFHRLPSTRPQPSFPLDKKVEGPAFPCQRVALRGGVRPRLAPSSELHFHAGGVCRSNRSWVFLPLGARPQPPGGPGCPIAGDANRISVADGPSYLFLGADGLTRAPAGALYYLSLPH